MQIIRPLEKNRKEVITIMKTQLIRKAAAVVSTGSIMLSIASPAFALTIESGNSYTGAESDNDSKVHVQEETTVVQDNVADIQNNIEFFANTGKNENSMNTGDSVTRTGDVNVFSGISNQANSNFAQIPSCGTCDTQIQAGSNKTGYGSNNDSKVGVEKVNQLFQTNAADVDNKVKIKTDTGNNVASKNLYGSVIRTGEISGSALVENNLNNNVGIIEGGNAGAGSLFVSGNSETGAESDNESRIHTYFANIADQQNIADVDNDAYFDFETGHNEGSKNTGYTEIRSGSIGTLAGFSTTANHNFAVMSSDCCDTYVVDGNHKTGYGSDNDSKTWIERALEAFQTNGADVDNNVKGKVNTGYNEANKNNDPLIVSGEIEGYVQVEDGVNENVLGDVSLPDSIQIGNDHSNFDLWTYLFGLHS